MRTPSSQDADQVQKPGRITLNIMLFTLILLGKAAHASPCARVKSESDTWVTAQSNGFVRAARAAYKSDNALPTYHIVLDRIANSIRKCRLFEDDAFMSRHGRFVDYIQAVSLERRPDHQLGFTVTDEQYFEETRQYVQIPEFLMDQAFLRSVSAFETLERAKAFLRQLNLNRQPSEHLLFFSYTSRHLGTPDNDDSYRRLLIVVPGNVEKGLPDKWVQFGVTDPGARVRIKNVSVVSAMPGRNGTFDIYFKDYYRRYGRDGLISAKGRWELGEGDDNCVLCHKSGVLPIFPERGSVSPKEEASLMAVNDRFRTYGAPRFGKYLDETKFGPGLSSATLDSRIKRFGPGFERGAVERAMTCSSCHHSERFGALNWPMDNVVIKSFINAGRMPPGHGLKVSERRELYANLIQEYFATDTANPGILKSWLVSIGR